MVGPRHPSIGVKLFGAKRIAYGTSSQKLLKSFQFLPLPPDIRSDATSLWY
jgi:hypothetical protein